ncbi:DUF881 domain-containing protein [Clostridium thailandense]|uniref:DUF881 domain-containing protein n=1 Tax=Clostridium thailandense TaxID=2794346 RepID=A0A949TTE6_9CLOT|nr:DUF881 domain-containing protein [Clostridium thailandense]MBV7275022.1 DUF881 domain-containing protein [Clostridium thailandense]MCH5136536.1 DUF881 domain-containing protein [Clostridiaceae bacterium UIB06]
MKNHEAEIFVFIASIIIGILISMNISFTRETEMVFLSTKQYQDAYNYKNKLYSEITDLMEQYDSYNEKLSKYKSNEKDQVHITENIHEELNENNIILGKTPVQGQGIIVTLNDASEEDINNAYAYERELRLIHNTDIIQVINDLKNAGAEAISINGQRIIDKTEIYCSGPFIRANGVKIAVPFIINAIGNKEVLNNYMLSNENYLKTLMTRKTRISVEQSDEINIPAYSGEEKNEYIRAEE